MIEREDVDALRKVAEDATAQHWHDAHFYAPQLMRLLAAIEKLPALTADDVKRLRGTAGDYELSSGRYTSVGHELLALAERIERSL